MAEPLTQLERKVYHFMIDFLAENTFQPSIREIARRFRIKSTKTVSDLLQSLEAKGFIERDEARSRGVRLLGFAGGAATQPIPCFTRLHSGEPALRPEHRKGFVTVDRRFLPTDDVFMLQVRAGAPVDHGIVDGDYVMVSPSAFGKDGDLVLARVGGDAVIRAMRRRGAAIVLMPPNDSLTPIEVEGSTDGPAVLGVICGVFRPFCDRERASTIERPPLNRELA